MNNLIDKVMKSNPNHEELLSLFSDLNTKMTFSEEESITVTKDQLLSLFEEFSQELAFKVVDTAFIKYEPVETAPEATVEST